MFRGNGDKYHQFVTVDIGFIIISSILSKYEYVYQLSLK